MSFQGDTSRVWATMPMANPYPGTIAQVIVGPECADPPLFFGTLTVRPHEPGARVVVDVIPSLRADAADVLDCDNVAVGTLWAHPATVNGAGENRRSHRLRGEQGEGDDPRQLERREETLDAAGEGLL